MASCKGVGLFIYVLRIRSSSAYLLLRSNIRENYIVTIITELCLLRAGLWALAPYKCYIEEIRSTAQIYRGILLAYGKTALTGCAAKDRTRT